MKKKAIVLLNPGDRCSHMFDFAKKYKCIPVFLFVDQNNTKEINDDIISVLNKCKKRIKNLILIKDEGSMDKAISKLSKYQVEAIVPYEETVIYGDILARKLNSLGNDPTTSLVRKNKGLLNELLAKKGIMTIKDILYKKNKTSIEEIEKKLSFPMIIKPSFGSSSMYVYKLHNHDELLEKIKFFDKMSKKELDNLGDIIIQEFIEGIEYPINFVAHEGKIIFTDAWEYIKIHSVEGRIIYNQTKLINPMGKDYDKRTKAMIAYGKSILDAMGWQNGPIHLEVMWSNKTNKPYLIEANLRLMGGAPFTNPPTFKDITLVELALLSLMKNKKNEKYFTKKYEVSKKPCNLFLNSYTLHANASFKIREVMSFNKLKQLLPSIKNWKVYFKKGDVLPITKNYINYPAELELASASLQQINNDVEKLKSIEDNDLFPIFK